MRSSVDARNCRRCSALNLEKSVRRVSSSNIALNQGCNPVLSFRQRDVLLQPAEDLHPARATIEHRLESGNGLGRHDGWNPKQMGPRPRRCHETSAQQRRQPSSGTGSPTPFGPRYPGRLRIGFSRSRRRAQPPDSIPAPGHHRSSTACPERGSLPVPKSMYPTRVPRQSAWVLHRSRS